MKTNSEGDWVIDREPLNLPGGYFYDQGTPEQVAQRLAAYAIAYRANETFRPSGWVADPQNEVVATRVFDELARLARELYAKGTAGLGPPPPTGGPRHG